MHTAKRPDRAPVTYSKSLFNLSEFTLCDACVICLRQIWPGASTIANYLVAHQQAVCDKRVVELGCGLGLCSVVAAILGAKVRISRWNLGCAARKSLEGSCGLCAVESVCKHMYMQGSGGRVERNAGALLGMLSCMHALEAKNACVMPALQVVATDGDADLVRLLRKNIAANVSSLPAGAASGVHPAATAVLDWGNAESTAKLVEQHGNPDVIIMSDCVYGSNPGVWERLLDTLGGLSTPSTRVIQAETKRIEGVLYHMYTDMACDRGWSLTELDATPYLPADSAAGNVRLWLMERAPAAQ